MEERKEKLLTKRCGDVDLHGNHWWRVNGSIGISHEPRIHTASELHAGRGEGGLGRSVVLGLEVEKDHVADGGLDCVWVVDFGGAAYYYLFFSLVNTVFPWEGNSHSFIHPVIYLSKEKAKRKPRHGYRERERENLTNSMGSHTRRSNRTRSSHGINSRCSSVVPRVHPDQNDFCGGSRGDGFDAAVDATTAMLLGVGVRYAFGGGGTLLVVAFLRGFCLCGLGFCAAYSSEDDVVAGGEEAAFPHVGFEGSGG